MRDWLWRGVVVATALTVAILALLLMVGCQSPTDYANEQIGDMGGSMDDAGKKAQTTRDLTGKAKGEAKVIDAKAPPGLKPLTTPHVGTTTEAAASAEATVKALAVAKKKLAKLAKDYAKLAKENAKLKGNQMPSMWWAVLVVVAGLAVLAATVYCGAPAILGGLGNATLAKVVFGGGLGGWCYLVYEIYKTQVWTLAIFAGVAGLAFLALDYFTKREGKVHETVDSLLAKFKNLVQSIQAGRDTLDPDIKAQFNAAVDKIQGLDTAKIVTAVKADIPLNKVL